MGIKITSHNPKTKPNKLDIPVLMPIKSTSYYVFLLLSVWVLLFENQVIAQNFTETQKVVAPFRAEEDEFSARALAMDGNIAVIGCKNDFEDENENNPLQWAGAVYVYERNVQGIWVFQQKLVASDREKHDKFGNSVGISGNTIVVGALNGEGDSLNTNHQINTGSVYIFERQPNGVWTEIQEITATQSEQDDKFGCSVAISNNHIIVGAFQHKYDLNHANPVISAGAAYIFKKNGAGVWLQKSKHISIPRPNHTNFGNSVDIYQNEAIISGRDSLTGTTTVLRKNANGNWVQHQVISLPSPLSVTHHHVAQDISNKHIIVGSHLDSFTSVPSGNSSEGRAFVYEKDASGIWNLQQELTSADSLVFGYFGISVSLSGNHAIIGAFGEESVVAAIHPYHKSGAAYIFRLDTNNQWVQEQKLLASDRTPWDEFGYSVVISDDYAMVGSLNSTDTLSMDTIYQSGSAYMFKKPPCLDSDSSFSVTECESYTVPSNQATYSSPGNYTVNDTLPNHCGGDSILIIDLTILDYDSLIAQSICPEDTVWVNGNAYHAQNPSGTETISNVGPFNCDSVITVMLYVLPNQSDTISEIICPEDTLMINGTAYHSNNLTGVERFQGSGPLGCDSTVFINLRTYSEVYITFEQLNEVCEGAEVTLSPEVNDGKLPYSYLWTTALGTETGEEFSFTPEYLTFNEVNFSVVDACNYTDTLSYYFTINTCEIVIPNIITPNGDGVNDYFKIIGLEYIDNFELEIFNRWGVLLYRDTNYRNNWDAYRVPDGTYFYILKVENKGETTIHNGPITVLRNMR